MARCATLSVSAADNAGSAAAAPAAASDKAKSKALTPDSNKNRELILAYRLVDDRYDMLRRLELLADFPAVTGRIGKVNRAQSPWTVQRAVDRDATLLEALVDRLYIGYPNAHLEA